MLTTPLIAVLAAIVLQSGGFEFAAGAPLVACCLALSQIAYLVGVLLSPAGGSIAEQLNGIPGSHRKHKIHGQKK